VPNRRGTKRHGDGSITNTSATALRASSIRRTAVGVPAGARPRASDQDLIGRLKSALCWTRFYGHWTAGRLPEGDVGVSTPSTLTPKGAFYEGLPPECGRAYVQPTRLPTTRPTRQFV